MKLVMRWPCPDCGAVLFSEVDAWYRAYAPQLRRLVGRFAADRGVPQSALDPEDVVNDVFELLQTRLGHADVRKPAGWLRKVAERYVARAHGEMQRVADGNLEDHLIELQVATRWSSLARTADLDTIVEYRAALAAIAALPDRQRAAVYLQRIQGMSHGEIAERLGIAAATVSVHAHRGGRSVREALGEEVNRQQAMIERMRSTGMLMAPRWAAHGPGAPAGSLPEERGYADELLSLSEKEPARPSGDDGDPVKSRSVIIQPSTIRHQRSSS